MREWERAAAELARALAATDATPGGGSAAAATAAFGCALGEMAAGISARRKGLEEERRRRLEQARESLAGLRAGFLRRAGEDADAFEAVMVALKLPKGEPGRDGRVQGSLLAAAEAPAACAREAAEALRGVRAAAALASGSVASDMSCAAHLLRAAALCALENVAVNLATMKDPGAVARLRAEADAVRLRLDEAC